tara:strand:+ start:11144 stop:11377 length:234 start_codon:yes stop_codon:yes gene_type:complete
MNRLATLVEEVRKVAQSLEEFPAKVALSPLQEEYRKYFMEKMDEHGVNSPSAFDSEEDMKKFFTEVTQGWEKGQGRK